MASPSIAKAPSCTSCIRRLANLGGLVSSAGGQQIRGKKTLASAKIATVNVQLLRNVPGYGRKGQILPITPGVMRNIWYPKKIAGYVTSAKLEALGKEATFERDPTFASNKQRLSLKQARAPTPVRPKDDASAGSLKSAREPSPVSKPIKVEALGPEKSTEVLIHILPGNIDFYRTPIVAPPSPKKLSPSISTGAALSAAAAAAAAERAAKAAKEVKSDPTEKVGIYGSVSTSDIAANLKAILAEDEEGRRVQLSPENISFVEETEEKSRVKHLGSFDIEIRLTDSTEVVRKKITVRAQE